MANMISYTHNEMDAGAVADILGRQQEANAKDFPEELLAAVDAALGALPAHKFPVIEEGQNQGQPYDDGVRVQATLVARIDQDDPVNSLIRIEIGYVKRPLL
jgi:hypothetical protein